jgi:hypothetical protein
MRGRFLYLENVNCILINYVKPNLGQVFRSTELPHKSKERKSTAARLYFLVTGFRKGPAEIDAHDLLKMMAADSFRALGSPHI